MKLVTMNGWPWPCTILNSCGAYSRLWLPQLLSESHRAWRIHCWDLQRINKSKVTPLCPLLWTNKSPAHPYIVLHTTIPGQRKADIKTESTLHPHATTSLSFQSYYRNASATNICTHLQGLTYMYVEVTHACWATCTTCWGFYCHQVSVVCQWI